MLVRLGWLCWPLCSKPSNAVSTTSHAVALASAVMQYSNAVFHPGDLKLHFEYEVLEREAVHV